MAKEKFQIDTVNIQTALEKFPTNDDSCSNGLTKIMNGWR